MNNLKRYDMVTVQCVGFEITTMERAGEGDEGEWVRYTDAAALLQAAAPPAPTAEPRLTTLGDAIRELRELVRTEAGHIAYFDDHLDAVVAAALRKGSAPRTEKPFLTNTTNSDI